MHNLTNWCFENSALIQSTASLWLIFFLVKSFSLLWNNNIVHPGDNWIWTCEAGSVFCLDGSLTWKVKVFNLWWWEGKKWISNKGKNLAVICISYDTPDLGKHEGWERVPNSQYRPGQIFPDRLTDWWIGATSYHNYCYLWNQPLDWGYPSVFKHKWTITIYNSSPDWNRFRLGSGPCHKVTFFFFTGISEISFSKKTQKKQQQKRKKNIMVSRRMGELLVDRLYQLFWSLETH